MRILLKASELYQDMWKVIIRPPRDQYSIADLGPAEFQFEGNHYKRRDFSLKNQRGLRIQCSHFEPVDKDGNYLDKVYPCVIYLHGNCSSRLEAISCGCVRALLSQQMSVFCFDFTGCGLSDGEYVSLGWHERKDLKIVVEHLRELGRISTIGLWGRSMGAVTACMYADIDPSVAALVIDSPFTSLRKLAEELASDFVGWKVPKILVNAALNIVRNTVHSKAKFNLDRLQPIKHCKRSYTPALFIAAKNDTFIRPHHCRELHDVYPGDKNFILVDGEHNSNRPSFLHDSIAIFFHYALQLVDPKVNKSNITVWDGVATTLAVAERIRRSKFEKLQENKNNDSEKHMKNEINFCSKNNLFYRKIKMMSPQQNIYTDSSLLLNKQSSSDSNGSTNVTDLDPMKFSLSPPHRVLKSYLEPLKS